MMEEGRRKRLKEMLLDEKRRLWNELREDLFRELGESYHDQFEIPLDVEDIALADYIEEIGLSIAETKRDRLIKIEDAIRRLEEGKYGVCERCGKEIDEARLSALFFATHCRECQEKEEQGPRP